MKIKAAFVALVMFLGVGAASANDLHADAGTLPVYPGDAYGHIFVHTPGAFTDTVDFYLPEGSLGSSANPIKLELVSRDVFGITGLTYELFGGTSPSTSISYGSFTGNGTQYDIPTLVAGNYHFLITGNATGSSGGAYAIALIASVPEPATYAMMLVGLGLIGFAARRNKSRKF